MAEMTEVPSAVTSLHLLEPAPVPSAGGTLVSTHEGTYGGLYAIFGPARKDKANDETSDANGPIHP